MILQRVSAIINAHSERIEKMASRKGVVLTVIILAAITAASFSLWLIPQNYEATFVVTDYESYLDGVKKHL